MTALAWPLVVLVVGIAFAGALALYLLDKRRAVAELRAASVVQAATVAKSVAKTEQLAAAGEALALRLLSAEDSIKALEQRMPAARLAR